MNTQIKGILGETIAAFYLRLRGFEILARRFKTVCGEIDIIAKKQDLIVFVEVKARKHMDDSIYAVRNKQLCRIQRASQIFLKRYPSFMTHQIRYDAILISDWCMPMHLENVYMQ